MGGYKKSRPPDPPTSKLKQRMTSLEHAVQELISGNENRAEASARSFASYGAQGIEALNQSINRSEADARWWAVRAAAEFDPAEFPKAAHLMLYGLDDPDPGVQTCAAVALRQRPTPAAIPFLIDLLSTPDQLLRRTVSDALVALEGRAVEALIQHLQTGDVQPRGKTEAVRALALIGDPQSISTLFAAWERGSQMQQHWAERGRSSMGVGMEFFDPGGS